jgi:hypothetical protein
MATIAKAKAKANGTYVHVPSNKTKLTHFTKIASGWYK